MAANIGWQVSQCMHWGRGDVNTLNLIAKELA